MDAAIGASLFFIIPTVAIIICKVYYCNKKCKKLNCRTDVFECIKQCANSSMSDEIIKKIMESENDMIKSILNEEKIRR
ncbi:hypothetical protein MFS40622_1770 [Methanocaldococcus sp. FS406-22]|uniref:hypothetical protein n=1 Tax=Methanocaldococcus sp. (strain FS406-22) TaxID=644281 RepID=UPI0001BF34E0|nr:hypothetical protein [Methanocaldococcus sp. FS406-22]ADC70441.1 hypothetical protein MFS40622_1770 [Methanocaldococcus sp. FS406-22]